METIYEQEFGPIRRGTIYRTTRSSTPDQFLVLDTESMPERVLGVDVTNGMVPDIVLKSLSRTELMEPMGEALPMFPWTFTCMYRGNTVEAVAKGQASLPAVYGDSNLARLTPLNDQYFAARHHVYRHEMEMMAAADGRERVAQIAQRLSHEMARHMRESLEQQIVERLLASVKARGWIK